MEKEKREIENIDELINDLKEDYSKLRINSLLIKYLTNQKLNYDDASFVNNYFSKIDRDVFIKEIAKHNLKVLSLNSNEIPYTSISKHFLKVLEDKNIKHTGVIDYLKSDDVLLSFLTIAFIEQRYYSNTDLNQLNEKNCNGRLNQYLYYLEDTNKGENNTSVVGKISNLVFNRSRDDVLSKAQTIKKHVDYSLGKHLYASMDMGKGKKEQEDGVLLLEHPNNKKFKLLAVADGIDYSLSGEQASNYALASILNWFEKLNDNYFENIDDLGELLVNKLRQINVELLNEHDGRGTTFTCAIVGKDKTLICSIGDSRAYKLQNEKLERLTKDDSHIQFLNEVSGISEDKLKFHRSADIVSKYLGMVEVEESIKPQIKVINNDDYDQLLLFTDGVTRYSEEENLRYISSRTMPKEVAKKIIMMSKNSILHSDGINYEFKDSLVGGKENSSCCVYVKRR